MKMFIFGFVTCAALDILVMFLRSRTPNAKRRARYD